VPGPVVDPAVTPCQPSFTLNQTHIRCATTDIRRSKRWLSLAKRHGQTKPHDELIFVGHCVSEGDLNPHRGVAPPAW
jgi:hypothetical protein